LREFPSEFGLDSASPQKAPAPRRFKEAKYSGNEYYGPRPPRESDQQARCNEGQSHNEPEPSAAVIDVTIEETKHECIGARTASALSHILPRGSQAVRQAITEHHPNLTIEPVSACDRPKVRSNWSLTGLVARIRFRKGIC
jgi:hypothetical protein